MTIPRKFKQERRMKQIPRFDENGFYMQTKDDSLESIGSRLTLPVFNKLVAYIQAGATFAQSTAKCMELTSKSLQPSEYMVLKGYADQRKAWERMITVTITRPAWDTNGELFEIYEKHACYTDQIYSLIRNTIYPAIESKINKIKTGLVHVSDAASQRS